MRLHDASTTGVRDAVVMDGADPVAVAERCFDDPAVERLHVHDAAPGCWARSITRR